MLANVRSYLPKKEAFVAILEDNSTDIAILTETWLTASIRNEELLHDNTSYHVHRLDRAGRRGGGVLIFVKAALPSSHVQINTSHEIISVNISFPSSTNILIACYRAPDSEISFIYDLHSVMLDICRRFPRANYFLCGDFNFPDIDWDNLCASSHQSKVFLDFVLTFNLTQAVKMPTRGVNTLDLVLTSKPDLIQSLSCIDGLSDHSIVLFDMRIPIPHRLPTLKYIRDYNKANFTGINTELENFYRFFKTSAIYRTVEQNWLLYKHKIQELIEKYVPLVCVRGDANQPWYSNTLKNYREGKNACFERPN